MSFVSMRHALMTRKFFVLLLLLFVVFFVISISCIKPKTGRAAGITKYARATGGQLVF